MPLTRDERLYYAGFFDGEGYISLMYCRTNNFRGWRFRVEIGIGQVDKTVLVRLHEEFGGSMTLQTRHKMKNAKPIWQLHWSHKQAKSLLIVLLPYLRLRRRRAELAIEASDILSSLRGGRGHGVPYPERLVEIYKEMKQLNKRGRA